MQQKRCRAWEQPWQQRRPHAPAQGLVGCQRPGPGPMWLLLLLPQRCLGLVLWQE